MTVRCKNISVVGVMFLITLLALGSYAHGHEWRETIAAPYNRGGCSESGVPTRNTNRSPTKPSYKLSISGQKIEIDEHGICRGIQGKRNLKQDLFIPTKTAQEWCTFIAKRPSDQVRVSNCANRTQVGVLIPHDHKRDKNWKCKSIYCSNGRWDDSLCTSSKNLRSKHIKQKDIASCRDVASSTDSEYNISNKVVKSWHRCDERICQRTKGTDKFRGCVR